MGLKASTQCHCANINRFDTFICRCQSKATAEDGVCDTCRQHVHLPGYRNLMNDARNGPDDRWG